MSINQFKLVATKVETESLLRQFFDLEQVTPAAVKSLIHLLVSGQLRKPSDIIQLARRIAVFLNRFEKAEKPDYLGAMALRSIIAFMATHPVYGPIVKADPLLSEFTQPRPDSEVLGIAIDATAITDRADQSRHRRARADRATGSSATTTAIQATVSGGSAALQYSLNPGGWRRIVASGIARTLGIDGTVEAQAILHGLSVASFSINPLASVAAGVVGSGLSYLAQQLQGALLPAGIQTQDDVWKEAVIHELPSIAESAIEGQSSAIASWGAEPVAHLIAPFIWIATTDDGRKFVDLMAQAEFEHLVGANIRQVRQELSALLGAGNQLIQPYIDSRSVAVAAVTLTTVLLGKAQNHQVASISATFAAAVFGTMIPSAFAVSTNPTAELSKASPVENNCEADSCGSPNLLTISQLSPSDYSKLSKIVPFKGKGYTAFSNCGLDEANVILIGEQHNQGGRDLSLQLFGEIARYFRSLKGQRVPKIVTLVEGMPFEGEPDETNELPLAGANNHWTDGVEFPFTFFQDGLEPSIDKFNDGSIDADKSRSMAKESFEVVKNELTKKILNIVQHRNEGMGKSTLHYAKKGYLVIVVVGNAHLNTGVSIPQLLSVDPNVRYVGFLPNFELGTSANTRHYTIAECTYQRYLYDRLIYVQNQYREEKDKDQKIKVAKQRIEVCQKLTEIWPDPLVLTQISAAIDDLASLEGATETTFEQVLGPLIGPHFGHFHVSIEAEKIRISMLSNYLKFLASRPISEQVSPLQLNSWQKTLRQCPMQLDLELFDFHPGFLKTATAAEKATIKKTAKKWPVTLKTVKDKVDAAIGEQKKLGVWPYD